MDNSEDTETTKLDPVYEGSIPPTLEEIKNFSIIHNMWAGKRFCDMTRLELMLAVVSSQKQIVRERTDRQYENAILEKLEENFNPPPKLLLIFLAGAFIGVSLYVLGETIYLNYMGRLG